MAGFVLDRGAIRYPIASNGSGTICGLQRTRQRADRLLQLVNTTDTEGQTRVERFPSPQTPLPGGPTHPHLKSNCLSFAFGAELAESATDEVLSSGATLAPSSQLPSVLRCGVWDAELSGVGRDLSSLLSMIGAGSFGSAAAEAFESFSTRNAI